MSKPAPGKNRKSAVDESPRPAEAADFSGERIGAVAGAQATLARRFDALERVVCGLRVNRGEQSGAARLSKLQEAVTDLAAAQRDVQRQLDALIGAVELLAGDGAGERAGERAGEKAGEKAGDGSGEGPGSAGAAPDRARPATFVPPASARSRRARLKHRARVVLRSTLGKLRQIWDAAHPRPPWGGEVRLVVKEQPRRRPSLTIVTPADRLDADAIAEVEAQLERQTERDFVRRIQGRDRAAEIDTDYVWPAGPFPRKETSGRRLGDLAPTFLETARLLLATEELGFVCFEAETSGARASSASQWIISSELWHPDGHLDTRALRRRAKRWPGRVLGKITGDDGDRDLLPQTLCRPEIRRHIRRAGAYVVPVATKPRIVEHRLTLPAGKESPCGGEAGVDRPGVLLLLSVALASGLERLVAAMLEDLGEDSRPVLVTVAPQTAWSGHRLRAAGRLTPHVYSLGGVFAEQLHASVIRELIIRHGVDRLVHAGGEQAWPALAAALRHRFPDLRIVDLALTGDRHAADHSTIDRHLAASAAAERALIARGVAADRILRLRPAADLEPEAPAAGAGERLRAAWGWGAETVLVAMCADFIAGQRPEDFVALAHRLRDHRRLRFLLVGDGPLSADLRDLKRLFALPNLRLERPERILGEILDAADVVCTTAESDPFPGTVLAALSRRRPVVAAAIGDLPRLLAAGPCGLTVPYPGDLDGFEAALLRLAAGDQRRELGERGPKAVRDFCHDGGANNVWRRALDLAPAAAARPGGHGDGG